MLFLGFFLFRVLVSLCKTATLFLTHNKIGKDNTTYPCVMRLPRCSLSLHIRSNVVMDGRNQVPNILRL